ETWPISSNFEQHPAWLTKVDRAEVEPVNYRSHRRIDLGNAIPPLLVFLHVGSAECYVVDATYANKAVERQVWLNLYMHLCPGSAMTHFKDGHRCLLRCLIDTAMPEAKHFGEKAC